MRFFDLFAGIGGFRLAFEREGFKCVGFCEIDKKARELYRAYYDTTGEVEYEDARKINPADLPDFDVLCAGFPCQSFSIAGKRRGFEDTRGTLFFEIARITEVKRPTHLLLENVKGLLSHDGGRTFEVVLKTLDDLGYDAEWEVLNSKDFGVPQHRERVFIVGHLRGKSRPQVFPITEADKVYYRPPKTKEKIYTDSNLAKTLTARQYGNWNGTYVYDPYNKNFRNGTVGTLRTNGSNGNSWILMGNIYPSQGQAGKVYNVDGIGPSLTTGDPPKVGFINKDSQGCRIYGTDGPFTTLLTKGSGNNLILTEKLKIRRLTPLECFRLQGFPDDIYYKARELGIADIHLYRFTGNSITVPVVQTIARKLKRLYYQP